MLGQLIQQLQDAGNVSYHKYHRTCPVCKKNFGTDVKQQIYCGQYCKSRCTSKSKARILFPEICELIRHDAMTRTEIAEALKCNARSVDENIADHRKSFYIASYKRVRGKFIPMFKTRRRSEKDIDLAWWQSKNGFSYVAKVYVMLTKEQQAMLNAKRGQMLQADYFRKLLEDAK